MSSETQTPVQTANIRIKGANRFDLQARKEALEFLQKEATTVELIKIKELAQNAEMRQLLSNL